MKCQGPRCEPQGICPFERWKEEKDSEDTGKCYLWGLNKTKSFKRERQECVFTGRKRRQCENGKES